MVHVFELLPAFFAGMSITRSEIVVALVMHSSPSGVNFISTKMASCNEEWGYV